MNGVHEAKYEKTVSTGIALADGPARSSPSYASDVVPGVRAVGPVHKSLAGAIGSQRRQPRSRKNLASSMYYPISARTEAAAATMAATMPISFTIG